MSYHLFLGFPVLCNSISVAVFAAKALDDEWMPGAYWNHFGFAFAFCAIGALMELLAGSIIFAQARKEKRLKTQPKEMHFAEYSNPVHYEPDRFQHPMTSTGSYSTGPSQKTTPSGSVDTDV